MIGRQRLIRQRFGVTVAFVFALSLAGPSTSYAAQSNATGTGYVNGLPCNDICKAYMAWSDRVMGRSRPSAQSQPKARIAVRHRKPDRPVYRVSETRHRDLSSFAQVLRRSDTAAQTAETPQVAVAAPSDPISAIAKRLSPADGIANARFADAGSATNEPPQRTLVSLTAPISATQDTSTTDDVARGRDRWLMASLVPALCAFLYLLYGGWFRHRTQAANRTR
jgi:hypothetical protein